MFIYCSGAVSGASTFFEGSSGREVSIRGIDQGQQLRDLSYKIRFIIILLAMRYVSFNWQYILYAFDGVSCQCSSVTRQPGSPPLHWCPTQGRLMARRAAAVSWFIIVIVAISSYQHLQPRLRLPSSSSSFFDLSCLYSVAAVHRELTD